MRTICVFLLLGASLAIIPGCTHELNVKNIETYSQVMFKPLSKPLKLGIITDTKGLEGKHLMTNISDTLMEYAVQPVMLQSDDSKIDVDAIAKIVIKSSHDGSGYNFWINWPGFLIFAPSWNGYIYEVIYRVNVQLVNPATKNVIDEFTLPITLDIRHADINRTWTEASWLEVSLIAFVGGLVFMSYDDTVTPLLIEKHGQTIGRYVAKNIINHLKAKGGFASQEPYRDISLAMIR